MMDELELLKKDWQKKDKDLPKLSYDDIYKMTWKKSSSFVKWIFYISILEFIFWLALSFVPLDSDPLHVDRNETIILLNKILEIAYYAVAAFFIYLFYQNYRKISATDNAKNLMRKIIKTRRTVMQYVWFNLSYFAAMMIIYFVEYAMLNPDAELSTSISSSDNSIVLWLLAGLALLGTIVIFALLLWLFYRLLYGILLRRLKENYGELQKLEF